MSSVPPLPEMPDFNSPDYDPAQFEAYMAASKAWREDLLARNAEAMARREALDAELRASRAAVASLPTGWEANPEGVSGRVVRGYRHWRNKR